MKLVPKLFLQIRVAPIRNWPRLFSKLIVACIQAIQKGIEMKKFSEQELADWYKKMGIK
jgi:hypothetical protein